MTNELFGVHIPSSIPRVECIPVGVRVALSQLFELTLSRLKWVHSHRDWNIDYKRRGRFADIRIEEGRLKDYEGSHERKHSQPGKC